MRRAAMLLLLLAVLVACTRQAEGPAAPIAAEQVTPGPALDAGAARQTVIEFLDAYASASSDGGAALADLVASEELRAWVHWFGVQDAQFPGTITGEPDLRGVAFLGSVPTDRVLGAQLDVGATITFSFEPTDGDPFERTRILDGPFTLASGSPGDWRVVDLTRDGIPMSDGIQLLRGEERTDHAITVKLDSLFMFAPNWQFNVVVENRSGKAIDLDPSTSALFVERAGGFEQLDGVTGPSLIVVPAGSSVEGLMSFPLQDSADGRVLVLSYRQGGRDYRFDFPLQGIVTVVPPPPPTSGAEVPAASS
jgi:hypothetical protein